MRKYVDGIYFGCGIYFGRPLYYIPKVQNIHMCLITKEWKHPATFQFCYFDLSVLNGKSFHSSFHQMILTSCFLWEFGRERFSGKKNSFSVLVIFSWGTEVVLVWTGTGDSRIHVSLSNKGDPIKVPRVK